MLNQGFPSETHVLAEFFPVSYSFLCSVKPPFHISKLKLIQHPKPIKEDQEALTVFLYHFF